jgi:hypothetical protein
MNERPEIFAPEPAAATPLRLVAAERLDRMQREVAALDLTADEPHEPSIAGTVVTSTNRIESLHAAVVALTGQVRDLAAQTASFSDVLTNRHLDYADQVRRLSMVAEESLAQHRAVVAERDATAERMADAIGQVASDLGGILEQVMDAVQRSREVSARNESLTEQLASGFARASQQLADQGRDLREELRRVSSAPASDESSDTEELASALHGAIEQLREDVGTDLAALRRLLSRGRTEEAVPHEELEALRVDITGEMEALVRELHDDQVLMMREILASQKEIKKLRDDVAGGVVRVTGEAASMPAQLENEMSRLLIELRALRRRPYIEPRAVDKGSTSKPAATPAKRAPARPRARLSATARAARNGPGAL